jgi:hypothetical protein
MIIAPPKPIVHARTKTFLDAENKLTICHIEKNQIIVELKAYKNMNFIIHFTLLFTLIISGQGSVETRQLRQRIFNPSKTTICSYVSPTVYETNLVSNGFFNRATYRGVKGDCQNASICQKLCKSYDTFQTSDKKCTCINSSQVNDNQQLSTPTAAPISSPTTTSTATITKRQELTCGINAEISVDLMICECKDGYEGDAMVKCTAIVSEKTVFCENPYGNPCGPNSACTDTPTGITCSATNLNSCPAGCGPNSTCLKVLNAYTCVCNQGFHRPEPYLPCIEDEQ